MKDPLCMVPAFVLAADGYPNSWWFDHSTCSGLNESNTIRHRNASNTGSVSESMLREDMSSGLGNECFSREKGCRLMEMQSRRAERYPSRPTGYCCEAILRTSYVFIISIVRSSENTREQATTSCSTVSDVPVVFTLSL